MTYGAKQYKQTSIKTASREQILLMLYEGAIRHLKRAAKATQDKKLAEKGQAIGKAHDIIMELSNSLDFEIGGEIARDLERLYNFMIELLIKANAENSADKIIQVQNMMENLLTGWRGAVEQLAKTKKE